jgi:hypothetical protein
MEAKAEKGLSVGSALSSPGGVETDSPVVTAAFKLDF